jgi:type IV pilus assembly protein PilB
MRQEEPLISFIKDEKILEEDTLQFVLDKRKNSGQSLISILKNDGLVNEEQLTQIIAKANKIEFVNLAPDMIDPMAAHLISYDIVNQQDLIPIRKENDRLFVAMSSPLNLSVRDQIATKTGYKIIPVAATKNAIRQAIKYHFNVRNVTRQDIVSMRLKKSPSEEQQQDFTTKMKEARVANAPVTRLVSSIINGAIDARASDIHIEPQEPDTRVRYRVDGILRPAIDVPSSVQREVVSHIKILADMDISEKRTPQDGNITLKSRGKEYDLRVSSLPAVGGEKIVIRVLDKTHGMWALDEVVQSPDDNKKIRMLAGSPYGMILATGPTGSGKTTTLYSVLQLLNTPERNIVTVEDPIEYRLPGITQVQVRRAAGMTFASGLRSILRQDPDVILVGEIRDFETAEIAISAALTGHLVLSTLHTNDAVGAISRLIDLGIKPFLVSSALLGVLGQRLIRTTCSKCKKLYKPTKEELNSLLGRQPEDKNIRLIQARGCNGCYQTGYHGRRAIYEIVVISGRIRNMIASGDNDDQIKQQAIEEGMKTLCATGAEQVLNGITTLAELLRVVDMREK